MRHLPDVRRNGMVSPLEFPHHRGIAAVPVLQGGPERTFALTSVAV
jgi:hypothetical protein